MLIDFVTDAPVLGSLDVQWVHGSPDRRHPIDPPIQVHRYDPHSYILRQSKDITFEAPFLYLLFGNERAVLIDTGATADRRVRDAVDGIVDDWLNTNQRSGYELIVAHTHGHRDHIAGDASFADRDNTTVVGPDLASVTGFFKITDWPEQTVTLDLGGRILEIIGIPGHHETSIACFDPWTGWLLTGDTIYPGRLYQQDVPASLRSFERLRDFAAERSVTHVLGGHVELDRAGHDYPPGCRFQPNEPALALTPDQLRIICADALRIDGRPGIHPISNAILYNGMGLATNLRLIGRSIGYVIGRAAGSRKPIPDRDDPGRRGRR